MRKINRNINVKLTEKSITDFTAKYSTYGFFERINGSYFDSYYKPYRDVQKQLIKAILADAGLVYNHKNIEINMSLTYRDENIVIDFSDWIPEIKISFKEGGCYYIDISKMTIDKTIAMDVIYISSNIDRDWF